MCNTDALRKQPHMSRFINKNCLNCKNTFKAEERYIKRGHAKFCSIQCSGSYHGKFRKSRLEPNVKCAHCEKEFYKNDTQKKNSKSGLFFCCRAHKDAAQKIGGISEIMPDHYGTGDGRYHYRKIAFASKEKKCERCDYDEHQAAIIVHHKDRDRSNNDISNLEVLCANCHAIEHFS